MKLWCGQTEEGSEGELPFGATGEEDSTDEENEQEEQSVNKGKAKQSLGKSIVNEEENNQRDKIEQHAEGGGGQKTLSTDPSKILPPAKPNILAEKPTRGTELMDPVAVQSTHIHIEEGIEKANVGVSASIQSCPNAEAAGGNTSTQITAEE
ncbi:hypothetical protein A4A49_18233 [Nicotiana attenuata]|uniref:Uncharacterized protein n=1 Tax=Nicotiana attenuata TaxID=49451 RepID=A0A314KSU7_NICAT|nr:hypothetical protein A4A49_18233 [Nicotiana attenuata]